MKNNTKYNIIIKMLIPIVVLIVFLAFIILFNNKEKTLKCKSLNQLIEIKFKNNNPIYISGKINLNEELTEEKLQNIRIYNYVIQYNKTENTINYAFSYDETNSDVLNFIGLSYNKKDKYKTIKKNLETNNFYCK